MGFWRTVLGLEAPEPQWQGQPLHERSAPTGVQPPPRTDTGAVTASKALGLDGVFRAVQIISTGVSQLTVDPYRGGTVLTGKQAAPWLRTPNLDESLSAFLGQTAVSIALAGNAFWRVYRSAATGDIVNLRVLPANEVYVALDRDTGERTYQYRGKDLDRKFIRQLCYLRIPGEARGLGPIQAAQGRLRGAVDLDEFAGDWFTSSGVPTGVLSTDQHLTGDQARAYREQWHESQAERGTAVLGAGLAYAPLHLSPKDAQFIENQQFSTTALARLFGIPAFLMLAAVEGSSMTYSNLAQADLGFARWTLSLYTREIEEAFSSLLPRGQIARFNLDAILRPDTTTRYEAHASALQNKWLTVDEVRALEGYAPLTAPSTAPEEGAE